jgi:hypothetical protein
MLHFVSRNTKLSSSETRLIDVLERIRKETIVGKEG